MLLECQNCGAPLDAAPDAVVIRCDYCRRSNQVGGLRGIAAETPPGWRPPPVWTPPEDFPAPSTPIRYSRPSARARVIVAIVAASIVVTSTIFFVAGASGGGAPSASKVDKAKAWDGGSTLRCDPGETLTIEDLAVTLAAGPVIHAGEGCKLTIRGCTFTAPNVLEIAPGASVVIESSTLDASQTAVETAQNVEVHVQKHSTVRAGHAAISTQQLSKVFLVDSSVTSATVAIDMQQESRIEGAGSTIHGDKVAIRTGQDSTVVLRATRVEGRREIGQNSRVDER